MEINNQDGFRECEHTADGEIEVWAQLLPALFVWAARGMYALMGMQFKSAPRCSHALHLTAADDEGLLVNFLSELLYFYEQKQQAFDSFDIHIQEHSLHARLEGAVIDAIIQPIKAVTYHHLAINHQDGLYRVRIVFDL